MRQVEPENWIAEIEACRAGGFDCLDMLAGVDRVEHVEVIASLLNPSNGRIELLSARVARGDSLPSVTAVFAGASWYEREITELLGLSFDGAPDTRPLLRRTDEGAPTLLKSTVLGTRALTPWPGDADAGDDAKANRRKQRPVGVPEGWLVDEAQR